MLLLKDTACILVKKYNSYVFDFLMWSSLVLDNVIKITCVCVGIAIIYATLKPRKTETKTTNYSAIVNDPNLSKEETEQLAKNVVDNMKKGLNKY
ncbi:hypothetical protein BN2127_JRS4_04580 [Bacillus cereus]|nr:hypothetical protein BN2127_JRS4_04580 [Bacillus cereus]